MQTKFRLSVRWLCFAVLLAAVVVRLAAQPGLRAHLVSVAAPPQAAEDPPEPAQDGSWPTLCYEPPSHDAPDLPAVTIDNRSGLPLEPDALPEAALALDRAQEGPLATASRSRLQSARRPSGRESFPVGDRSEGRY